jgi:hypothetical protein
MIADGNDARASRSHHSHRTTGPQTHLAEPMHVVGPAVDF